MGFLKRATGGTDKDLSQNGLLGRGIILDVNAKGTTVSVGNKLQERICEFTLEIALDNQPRYHATCKQRVPEVYIPQLAQNATVAVRVDPNDLQTVQLSLQEEPPTVAVAREAGQETAADVLANGRPAQAVIVTNQPAGMKTAEGIEVQAFKLTVIPNDGTDPYQIEVGNATPPSALPFLFPGSRVPVKIGSTPNSVVIDWAAAAAAPAAG